MPWRRHYRRNTYHREGRVARTNRPSEAIVLASAILWIIGFASLVLGVIRLPNNLGLWALVLAGFLMILASIVYGL